MSDWRKRARSLTETFVPLMDRANESLKKLQYLGVSVQIEGRTKIGDGPWKPSYSTGYHTSHRGNSVYDFVVTARDKLPEVFTLLAEAEEENKLLRAKLGDTK